MPLIVRARRFVWGRACLVAGLASTASLAAEVDNFTPRLHDKTQKAAGKAPLSDASAVLNGEVNRLIADAVATVNKANFMRNRGRIRCDVREQVEAAESEIIEEFLRKSGGQLVAGYEAWVDETPVLEASRLSSPDGGVYRHRGVFNSVTRLFEGPFQFARISSTVKIGEHYIGSDKLGHFFSHGWDYYRSYREEIKRGAEALGPPSRQGEYGKVLRYADEQAAKIGVAQEEGSYGQGGTGVYSYGDLNANYQGMRFWADFIHGDRPFVTCDGGVWKVTARAFDWNDYVSAAMDEGVNCSRYEGNTGYAVRKHVAELGLTPAGQAWCPVEKDGCEKLRDVPYEWMVTPVCQAIWRSFRVQAEPEREPSSLSKPSLLKSNAKSLPSYPHRKGKLQ